MNVTHKSTILVTGGAGFIGSHLVDTLTQTNTTVKVLDNFTTGREENLPKNHSNIEIIHGDITDTDLLNEVLNGVNCIVHLAAIASVPQSVLEPHITHQTNCIGTLNLLEYAIKHKVKRFLYASSAAVYGNTKILPIQESHAKNPLSPYAIDKLSSEHYVNFFQHKYGIETAIFRFFNVFGPRQNPSSDYSGVINIFAKHALNNKPITIFGNGEQSRDFIYVTDVINILYQVIFASTLTAPITNIGTGKAINLNTLVDHISDIVKVPLTKNYLAEREGDILHSIADIQILKDHFSNQSATPFIQGLNNLFNYLQDN